MIRELCKHFFQKSLQICKCAGRLTCSGRNEVAFQRVLGHAALFCSALRATKQCRPLRNALESNLIPALGVCTPNTVLKHVLEADANLVAQLCRALI